MTLRLVSKEPAVLATERAILASMMLWRKEDSWSPSDLAAIVDPEDFYRDAHGKLFELMLQRYEKGDPIDMLNIVEHVFISKNQDKYGGCSFISSLPDSVTTTEYAQHLAVVVRDTAAKRRLLHKLAEQHDALQNGHTLEEVRAELEATITSPGMEQARAVESISDVAPSVWSEICAEYKGERSPYFSTGIPTFDEQFGFNGISREGLTLVIARSSMGKTILCNRLVLGLASTGRRVLLCPTETSKKKRIKGLTFSLARVNMSTWASVASARSEARQRGMRDLPYQQPADDSLNRLRIAHEAIDRLPITLTETGFTVDRLCAEITRRHRQGQIDIAFVDYLQDLAPSRNVDHNRTSQVTYASKKLKDLSASLGLPIVLFAQAKHTDEGPKMRRSPNTPVNNDWLIPQMGSVQHSSQCYQDAEEVWSLYRRCYYTANFPQCQDLPGEQGMMLIAFRKRRVGGPGVMQVPVDMATKWIGDYPEDGGAF